ncbi:DUF5673 domain-containing protein [Clostridium chromiireducens]|uniref:DUF5673 domain-containing protein n=1 Tax=Clostridium chromiireducens TaxID=225345 RepID=UPI00311AB521
MRNLDISTILIIAFILIIDIVLIRIDIKNKLIFEGINKYKIIMPILVVGFVVATFFSNNYRLQDIIVGIAILPLAFMGNKRGITEKGFLVNSYVIIWDRVESFSSEEKDNKYIIKYKTNIGQKKVAFKAENKEEIKKYLQVTKRIKYIIK